MAFIWHLYHWAAADFIFICEIDKNEAKPSSASPAFMSIQSNPLHHGVFLTANKSSTSPLMLSVKHIHLLGERNSGTNFVADIMHTAFGSRYAIGRNTATQYRNSYDRNIPIYGFKHMFRHHLLNSSEISIVKELNQSLWVLAVRNPCDWADAMYRKPWHLCPPNKTSWCMSHPKLIDGFGMKPSGMTREDFFEMEWNDWPEMVTQRYNFSYHNIFALRSHKLSLMLQLIQINPHNVYVAHLKQISQHPEAFLTDLAEYFDLQVSGAISKAARVKKSICLRREEWIIAQKEINWDLEAFFGFNELDCRLCIRRLQEP
jgi:hypothetical protein